MHTHSFSFGENRLCRYQEGPTAPAPRARRGDAETNPEMTRIEGTYMRESFESLQDSLKTILNGYVRGQTAYLKTCEAAAKLPPETRPLVVGTEERMQAEHMNSLVWIVIRAMHAKSLEGTADQKKVRGEALEKCLKSITEAYDTVGIQWLYTYTPGDTNLPRVASHSWIPANWLEGKIYTDQKAIDDKTPGTDAAAARKRIEHNRLLLSRHAMNATDNFEWMGRRLLQEFDIKKNRRPPEDPLPSERDVREMEWMLSSARVNQGLAKKFESWIGDSDLQREFLKKGVVMSIRKKTHVIESAIGEIRLDTQYNRRWQKTKINEWTNMEDMQTVKDDVIGGWPTVVLNPRYEIGFTRLEVTDDKNEVEEQIQTYEANIVRNTAEASRLLSGRLTSQNIEQRQRLELENYRLKSDSDRLRTYLESLKLTPEKIVRHRINTLARHLGNGYSDEKDSDIQALVQDIKRLLIAGGKKAEEVAESRDMRTLLAKAGYRIDLFDGQGGALDIRLAWAGGTTDAIKEVTRRREDMKAMRDYAEMEVKRPDFYERDTSQPRTSPINRPDAPAEHPYRFTVPERGTTQSPQLIVKSDRTQDLAKYEAAKKEMLDRYKSYGTGDGSLIAKMQFSTKLGEILKTKKLALAQMTEDDVVVTFE